MQVVLTKDVPTLGRKGDVKNVKDGYFSNYLYPRSLAEMATAAALKRAEGMRKRQLVEKERVAEQAHEIKKKLDGLKLTLNGKARGDKLYGSITEKEIVDAIQEKINVRLEKSHIKLSEHIKVLGSFEVPVQLTESVSAKVMVDVKAEK